MWAACSRFLLCLLLAALLQGCSVRFAYNNADRLVVWQTGEYVDLDRAQRDWLRARARVFLHWHRTNQLPRWAAALRAFELAVQDGAAPEDLDALVLAGESWTDEIVMEILPTITEFLASLDAEQIAELPERFTARNAEFNEDYEGLAVDAQREVWVEEMRDALDGWVGDLDAGQELLLEAASLDVVPDNAHWIDYREHWQALLMDALARREEPGLLEATVTSLMVDPQTHYTPVYAEVRAHNDAVYRRFTLDLLASLNERQRERLVRRIAGLAEDFEALAAQVREPPEDPGPAPRPDA